MLTSWLMTTQISESNSCITLKHIYLRAVQRQKFDTNKNKIFFGYTSTVFSVKEMLFSLSWHRMLQTADEAKSNEIGSALKISNKNWAFLQKDKFTGVKFLWLDTNSTSIYFLNFSFKTWRAAG